MARIKRMERIVVLTKDLIDNPYELFPFSFFCEKFGVAKSTLSEDVQAVRSALNVYDEGVIETIAGASGGVRFIPYHKSDADYKFLQEMGEKLKDKERILPGGMIYMNDLLFMPYITMRLGEIIMQRSLDLQPDYIMTVEAKGIPLAIFVARAFNVPMVMARKEARITEGPAVSISYLSGSTKTVQSMSLPKKAVRPNSKVLIVDDFMRAGGTAKGMQELVGEVGAQVVGTYFLIASKEPEKKIINDYSSLFILKNVDEENGLINITPNMI